jgi:phosphatidyl-myo-inositol dimannoside synthase
LGFFKRHSQNLTHNPSSAKLKKASMLPIFYPAMDILIVTQDFPPERGGIQTYVLELARAFLNHGHRVRVICPGKKSSPNPLPALTEIVRIPIHSSWLFLALLGFLPRYLRRNPSVTCILYAQWPSALAEWTMLKSRKRHRSYSLVHGRELLTSVLGPLAPFFMRKAFGQLQAAFPNSQAVLDLTILHAKPSCALHLVHPGVDPAYFHPVNADFLRARYGLGMSAGSNSVPVILCITRMVARKNLRRLIQALPDIRALVPGTVLLLGGNGPERPDLENLVRELGIQGEVRFLGRIADSEMVAHYCLADVFALPSLSFPKDIEGFGIVFLEAGACEVAVLGSLSGGIPDAVVDGQTGVLVPAENLKQLKEALIHMLQNPENRQLMGKRARMRIEAEFTWDHISARMLAFMA